MSSQRATKRLSLYSLFALFSIIYTPSKHPASPVQCTVKGVIQQLGWQHTAVKVILMTQFQSRDKIPIEKS